MSAEEKMQILDDKFLQCEAVKNEVVNEVREVNEHFKNMLKMLDNNDQSQLIALLDKFKTFLSSTLTTLRSIQQSVSQLTSQFMTIQSTLRNMGA